MPDPAAAALRNPIGTHVLVGKGLVDGAVAHADEVGCETFQVFVGNPRGWALSPGRPAEDARFRDLMAERGTRTFIHAPYLVNLGSPTASTYENSVALLAHNLRRAAEIGAEGVVVHTGSFVDPAGDPADSERRYAAAMRQVRDGLLPLLDAVADDEAPWLLLEPTAGQGRSLCAGVEDLQPYLAALDLHPKAGICLDTCHVFAAGAPLDEPGGATATVDRIVEIGGPGRLRLIHANDSMDVRGAFKDRHQRIGEGHIGEGAFARAVRPSGDRGRPVHPGDAGLTPRRQPRHPPAEAAPPVTPRRTTLLATVALLAITACWGSTFFLIHDLLDRLPAIDFLAVRFTIAGALLLLVAPRAVLRLSPAARRQAVVLGGLYGVAQILQTVGLANTPASVSGFITGMYVVATPLFAAVLLHNRISRTTWGAVALAAAGLAVLTLDGFSVGYGEALTFVAAMLYALHIVGLGAWSNAGDALGLSILQVVIVAVICLVASAPHGIQLPDNQRDWLSVVYMAVFPAALALLGQTWAQAHLPPTRTAIVMSMEPVFAAFFAVLLGGESLTLRMLTGGLMVLTAMLVVEITPHRKVEAGVPHIAV